MKLTLHALCLTVVIFGVGCTNGGNAPTFDTAGYSISTIDGTTYSMAEKINSVGYVTERGYIDQDGHKTGAWTNFEFNMRDSVMRITTIMHFVGGQAHGNYYEFNDRGQIKLQTNYKGNRLDGEWAVYEFGSQVKRANYKDGNLDGKYIEYNRNGKRVKLVTYKNGVLDGPTKYYGPNGEVTVATMYSNGEKVN